MQVEKGQGKGSLGHKGVNEPRAEEGVWSTSASSPSQSPPWSSADVTYNGVVSMRKKAFLSRCSKVGTESEPEIMVQACASVCKGWFLRKRKLSSFRLGREIRLRCLVERTLIWRSRPPLSPSIGHTITRVLYAFLVSSFSFFPPLFPCS